MNIRQAEERPVPKIDWQQRERDTYREEDIVRDYQENGSSVKKLSSKYGVTEPEVRKILRDA